MLCTALGLSNLFVRFRLLIEETAVGVSVDVAEDALVFMGAPLVSGGAGDAVNTAAGDAVEGPGVAAAAAADVGAAVDAAVDATVVVLINVDIE